MGYATINCEQWHTIKSLGAVLNPMEHLVFPNHSYFVWHVSGVWKARADVDSQFPLWLTQRFLIFIIWEY